MLRPFVPFNLGGDVVSVQAGVSSRVRELVALTCGALAAPLLGQVLLRAAANGAPGSTSIWAVSLGTTFVFIIPLLRAAARVDFGGSARRVVALIGLFLVVLQGMRLSTYMAAADETKASIYYFPGLHAQKTRRTSYTTVTTYANAAAHNRADPTRNIYDERLYPLSVEGNAVLPSALPLRTLALDGGFLYPPAFLPIFRGLLLLGDDVTWLRTAWFALEAGLLVAAFFAMLPCLAPSARRHALLLAPWCFASFTTLVALQVGNYHVAMFALCVLGVAYTERGQQRLGGALLGVAAATKLYPFVFLLPLWVWHRRPAVGALLAAAAAQTLLAWVWCGSQPFLDFAHYALPRLSNGQAFPFLNEPTMLPGNFSAAALGFKLLTLTGAAWTQSGQHLLGKVLAVAVGLVACLALLPRVRDSHRRLLVCVGALNLLVLTPPWAPGYVQLGFLWLLLLLPIEHRQAVSPYLWGALCVALFCPDLPFLKPAWRMGYTLAVQLLGVGLNVWLLLRGARVPVPLVAAPGDTDEHSTRDFGILR
jgi:hypothetical protein